MIRFRPMPAALAGLGIALVWQLSCSNPSRRPTIYPGPFLWTQAHGGGACYSVLPSILSTAGGFGLIYSVSRTGQRISLQFSGPGDQVFLWTTGSIVGSQLASHGQKTLDVSSNCSLVVTNDLAATIPVDNCYVGALTISFDANTTNALGGPSNCAAALGSSLVPSLVPFPTLSNPTNGSCAIIEMGSGLGCLSPDCSDVTGPQGTCQRH